MRMGGLSCRCEDVAKGGENLFFSMMNEMDKNKRTFQRWRWCSNSIQARRCYGEFSMRYPLLPAGKQILSFQHAESPV